MAQYCQLCGQITNCTDNCNACLAEEAASVDNYTPFGDITVMHMIDALYRSSREILDRTGDIGEYTDDENEILDEISNFINAYRNAFNR
jgi:hypothetical protein